MKLSVMQENLARGLSVVSRAVSSRSTLPVLANVLLKTEDAGLKLTATNLEIGITYWVPGKIESDGATTVPAKLLTDLVNSLPAGDRVDLELDGRRHAPPAARPVRDPHQGHRRRRVPGHPDRRRAADDADRPERPAPSALAETAFAAASDEARPILTGVLARFEGDQLTLAAADNYRIAVKTDPDPRRRSRRRASSSRPGRSTSSRGSSPTSTTRSRSCSPPARNQVLFHLDGIDLVSRLIDGQFPNYQQVVPQAPHDPGRARSRGAPAGGPAGGAHRPRVGQHREAPDRRRRRCRASRSAPTPRSATTSARSRPRSRATGRRSRSTRATWPTSSTNVDADQFALELNGPLSPGVFKPIGDDHYVHVVMPVRTTS